jgi:ferric-dicitrate binding protein FerR (iron transport regulator)
MEDGSNTSSSWTDEQQRAIAWLALPRAERVPKTQRQLSAELDVTEETFSRWKRLPGFADAVNQLAKAYVKDDVPDVLGVIRKKAKAGELAYVNMVLSMAGLASDVEAAGKGPGMPVYREVIIERPVPDSDQ